MVHPYGELDLFTKQFISRKYFINRDNNEWVPSVFPFTHNKYYLYFRIQDDTNINETTRFVILDRFTDKVVRISDSGTKDIDLIGLEDIKLVKDLDF